MLGKPPPFFAELGAEVEVEVEEEEAEAEVEAWPLLAAVLACSDTVDFEKVFENDLSLKPPPIPEDRLP